MKKNVHSLLLAGMEIQTEIRGNVYGINRLVMKYFPEDKPESLDGAAAAPAPAS